MRGAVIRPAVPADASRLAEIQIFAKRTAFRSVFQNDFVSFNEMQVLEKNPAARSLYSRCGFSPDGSRKLQEGTSEYLLQYTKIL